MEFKSTEEKVCYGIGTQLGGQLANSIFPGFSFDALFEGIQDQIKGELQLDRAVIGQAFKELNEKLSKEQEALAKECAEKSAAYLAENKKKPGVVETASGLQYEVLKEGSGESPVDGSTVKVHYHGTFPDGQVFDSSIARGEPAVFGVNQVIKGWTEALKLMKVGSKYRLSIPADLAYGDHGAGSIPPKAALVFEVELLEIVK